MNQYRNAYQINKKSPTVLPKLIRKSAQKLPKLIRKSAQYTK